MRAIIFVLTLNLGVASAFGDVHVRGYYRKDGSFVRPHDRSDPDGIVENNWSYPGNVNPYAGAVGGSTHR